MTERRTFPTVLRALRATSSESGLRVRRRRRRKSRVRGLQPQMAQAIRLLRAAGRLGVPGALPGPPELLPMGARVLAQGYLNRFSMPVLGGWLIPRWMREQSDPDSPMFTPRSVLNLMVNQTARNWTALGIPGSEHTIESVVDRYGLLTPVPGGPSLDWWVDVDGGEKGRLAASMQREVVQSLQGGLPVVLTAYEADGLRVSSEAWVLATGQGDWAVMQVVLFNIADMHLKGTFSFALRPYNAEGISPINTITCDGKTLQGDARPLLITWPQPESWALSTLRSGDLFSAGREGAHIGATVSNEHGEIEPTVVTDPHGFAHGVLSHSFSIEPWEEAEFLAFMPISGPKLRRPLQHRPLFGDDSESRSLPALPDPHPSVLSSAYYSRIKAATTIKWRALLDSGMKVSLPHRELQASWDANRAHVLALHDGDDITPGPDIYHSFWFRDAAYMTDALSLCGFKEAAGQLLRGSIKRQRRDGAFVSHSGEWDSTGQVLWAIARHITLYRDDAMLAELLPSLQRGAAWIILTLSKSADGLIPPGISSEHFGPPDRYYWDDLWSLAGLEALQELLDAREWRQRPAAKRGNNRRKAAITRLRAALQKAWNEDAAQNGDGAIPAAPGRKIDLGAVGALAAWFPLNLLASDDARLPATLGALERATFYKGALFVNTGHSGWSSYLNMRIAGCYLLQGSPRGWDMIKWLLRHASPTYTWPEAIHPRSGGGSAGDGHHGWASAEWLMLVRAMLLQDTGNTLSLTPALPLEWLDMPGQITVQDAPTVFGPVSFSVDWDAGGSSINLHIDAQWRTPPSKVTWRVGSDRAILSPLQKTATITRTN